jgi:AcrR family transcriptional regulator
MERSVKAARPADAKSQQPASAAGPRERTRRLLLDGARELLQTGKPLTVKALAEHTGISRATVYRYFASNDAVALNAAMPLGDHPVDDPGWRAFAKDEAHDSDIAERAALLVRRAGAWAYDHETELRTILALSLAPDSERRGLTRSGKTRRHLWIASLLEELPASVSAADRERLALALTPLFGADAVVWLTDVAGLHHDEGLDLLAWMAAALVRTTLEPG